MTEISWVVGVKLPHPMEQWVSREVLLSTRLKGNRKNRDQIFCKSYGLCPIRFMNIWSAESVTLSIQQVQARSAQDWPRFHNIIIVEVYVMDIGQTHPLQ